MNILIVDDENVIREGIKRTIQKAYPHYEIHLAANPEEAVQLLRGSIFHLVLTDILMPGMTGLEFMQLSRSSYPNMKWVIISAYSEFAYAKEAVRLGAKDYLLKPIGKEMLIAMIKELSEEIEQETEFVQEAELLKTNLQYLRGAVFQRWATGLDIGRLDVALFIESYPTFQMIMVKMDSTQAVHLEHFIIENVLGELIDRYGRGFVTTIDGSSLIGLVTMQENGQFKPLLNELRNHLRKYVKVPFQIQHTDVINDFSVVPIEVRRMRQESVTLEYEYYNSGGSRAIEVAMQYIKAHYHTDLTLEKVASVVFLNPVYFSQLFKQKTGYGFKEYMTDLRIEQAKQLLLNPYLKLADISEKIGYQDVKHFTQVFRKRMNVTPTEYRQGHRLDSHKLCP